jgi:hypothetical protein
MKVVESPNTYSPDPEARRLYLAGGITKCPDWQQEMIHLLAQTDLVIFNPRRRHFPIEDPSAAEEQIRWEHHPLRFASDIQFWFPCETLCPIALYELGAWSMTDKPIYVGVHPEYSRRQDIDIQTELTRPWVEIVYSLQDLAGQVVDTLGE